MPATTPRLLIPSAALLWGLQFAFLNPALALLLVALFHANDAEVGLTLALYNAGGFVASLIVPARADRTRDYLRPMLVCSALTVALAAILFATASLPFAVVALVALGGPASVGSSLLFAHLKASGAPLAQMMNTRAIVSFAWVAGPPLATFLIGALGEHALLVAIAAVSALAFATTAGLRRGGRAVAPSAPKPTDDDGAALPRAAVAVVVLAFIALQATNNVVVSIMTLFTTQRLGLGIEWAGIALGVAAALEIPALLAIGKLTRRFSSLGLIATGCVVGTGYYVAMAFVSGPALLVAAQALNAWFFAVIAGVGLTYFQQIIPRPGLASGLFTNTRRLGAIVSGGIIGLGSTLLGGYGGVFLACAGLTSVALVAVLLVPRIARRGSKSGSRIVTESNDSFSRS